MNDNPPSHARIPAIAVPVSLIADPARFGGRRIADCLCGDLIVQDGKVTGLEPAAGPFKRIVTPRFTDPHVHLDKCHTVDRMPDVGGNLDDAIASQRADRAKWTSDDIRQRASRGLAELRAAGCGNVRSHVDWVDDPDPDAVPLAWDVLGDLASEMSGKISLERSALTSIVALADPDYADGVAKRIARDGGVLGAFIYRQPQRKEGLVQAFRAADRHGLALDFHVDEGLTCDLDNVEVIADIALETGFQGPVLLGHACSLMNLNGDDLKRVIDKVARAGISVTTLPYTNLFLQGRQHGTPDRRGLTRVSELRAGGVNTVTGADNVRDAFCPIGNHAPLATLSLAVLGAHLDPPFGDHLPMIATDADSALGRAPRTVDGARVEDLLAFDAASTSELLSGLFQPRALSDDCAGQESN